MVFEEQVAPIFIDASSVALWIEAPQRAVLKQSRLGALASRYARVRALFSAISRGTERLVFNGEVPLSQYGSMRAPYQFGEFSFPICYGYSMVGQVEAGDSELLGKRVFCLHPHQDCFDVPVSALYVLPDELASERAALAANLETALNALWDGRVAVGDRVCVIGAGTIGLMIAGLCAQIPGVKVFVGDINPELKNAVSEIGGEFFVVRGSQPLVTDCDVVFHTSASEQGLQLAMASGGFEARIIEVSWFGKFRPQLALGEIFHSRRLRLISSQVGSISPRQRAGWTFHRRLRCVFELLQKCCFNNLIDQIIPFTQAPDLYAKALTEYSGVTLFSYQPGSVANL